MSASFRTLLLSSSLALAFGASAALAQSSVGHMAGDASQGDVVLIRHTGTQLSREVTVGDNGRFQLRNLPNGRYEVRVRHADGREEAPRLVDVRAGRTTQVR